MARKKEKKASKGKSNRQSQKQTQKITVNVGKQEPQQAMPQFLGSFGGAAPQRIDTGGTRVYSPPVANTPINIPNLTPTYQGQTWESATSNIGSQLVQTLPFLLLGGAGATRAASRAGLRMPTGAVRMPAARGVGLRVPQANERGQVGIEILPDDYVPPAPMPIYRAPQGPSLVQRAGQAIARAGKSFVSGARNIARSVAGSAAAGGAAMTQAVQREKNLINEEFRRKRSASFIEQSIPQANITPSELQMTETFGQRARRKIGRLFQNLQPRKVQKERLIRTAQKGGFTEQKLSQPDELTNISSKYAAGIIDTPEMTKRLNAALMNEPQFKLKQVFDETKDKVKRQFMYKGTKYMEYNVAGQEPKYLREDGVLVPISKELRQAKVRHVSRVQAGKDPYQAAERDLQIKEILASSASSQITPKTPAADIPIEYIDEFDAQRKLKETPASQQKRELDFIRSEYLKGNLTPTQIKRVNDYYGINLEQEVGSSNVVKALDFGTPSKSPSKVPFWKQSSTPELQKKVEKAEKQLEAGLINEQEYKEISDEISSEYWSRHPQFKAIRALAKPWNMTMARLEKFARGEKINWPIAMPLDVKNRIKRLVQEAPKPEILSPMQTRSQFK